MYKTPSMVCKDEMADMKLSALLNAARISHLVTETTIGPKCKQRLDNELSHSVIESNGISNNNNENNQLGSVEKPKNKWRTDVWRPVKDETEPLAESSTIIRSRDINLNDCKLIRFRMAQTSAEKHRKAQVRKQIAERHSKMDKLEDLMSKMRLNIEAETTKNLQKTIEQREREFAEAIQEIEMSTKQASEQVRLEQIEHQRQKAERILRLQQEQERLENLAAIKSYKNLFILVFEKFNKTILSNQQVLSKLNEYVQQRTEFLTRYENVLKTVNSGHLTGAEVNAMERICDDIKLLQQQIDAEIEQYSEEMLRRRVAENEKLLKAQENAQQQQQQQQQQQHNQQQQHHQQQQPQQQQQQQQQQHNQPQQHQQQLLSQRDTTDGHNITTTTATTPRIIDLSECVNLERLKVYQQLISFVEQYEATIKPIESDERFTKFCLNCRKAINTPLNTICPKNPQKLQDIFDKVALVLFGSPVKINGAQFTSSEHPLGVKFCTMLVAKRFVNLADAELSSKPSAAFPMAAILVALWQKFPDVGQLFLAYLYKECPFLVPYNIPQVEGQSDEEYFRLIGYRDTDFENPRLETNEEYLTRISGFMRLYSAVLITKSRRSQATVPNPFGLKNGWIWFSCVLNLDPSAGISTTLLLEFLCTAGADMLQVYGKQFIKLLQFLHRQYFEKLNMIDDDAPKKRLEILLDKIVQQHSISPPDGILPDNFW